MCTTRIYIQAGREGERLECEDFRACRLEDGGGVCACGLWEGCECRVGVGGGRLGVERGWSRRVGVTLSKYVCQNSMPAELQFNRDLFLPFFFSFRVY